ncbi:unnamed protein product [Gongylonema pulchrum]|uniref:Secreted protein n=1 Tax=Gongylonema pulchrum TaxID=637853 RepID=A0A183DHF7_9BILA|nr:unnamed protein product [Gongylonema pulchrum]
MQDLLLRATWQYQLLRKPILSQMDRTKFFPVKSSLAAFRSTCRKLSCTFCVLTTVYSRSRGRTGGRARRGTTTQFRTWIVKQRNERASLASRDFFCAFLLSKLDDRIFSSYIFF